MKPYVYFFVRKDIPAVQKAVQIGHAGWEAGNAFKAPEDTCSVVLLQVENEDELKAVAARLDRHAVDHRMFYEPAFGPMGFSALATRPVTRKKERFLFANYEKLEM
jgi:hypothetical protein